MFKQTFQRRCVICGNPTSRNDAKYCCRACVAEAQRRAVYRHCCKLCGAGYKSGSPTPGLCSEKCRRTMAKNTAARNRSRLREQSREQKRLLHQARLAQDRAEAIFGEEFRLVSLPEDYELAALARDFLPPASLEAPQRPIDPFLGF